MGPRSEGPCPYGNRKAGVSALDKSKGFIAKLGRSKKNNLLGFRDNGILGEMRKFVRPGIRHKFLMVKRRNVCVSGWRQFFSGIRKLLK